ncbi:MAG: hypothetical protein OHK0029_31590 [Armatimonadaceae bacterium]
MKQFNSPFAEGSASARAAGVRSLLIACVITFALYFIPYAGYVTYPIRILVTFIHEGAHALMALLTGSTVDAIAVMPNGSGVTLSRTPIGPAGWLPNMLISSAGYLGATLYGAILVWMLRRGMEGRKLLLMTGIAVALVTLGAVKGLAWPPAWVAGASPFGLMFALFWGVLLTAGLLIGAKKLPRDGANWLASFVGVQCVLNALFDLRTLFDLSVGTSAHTDARNMEALTLLPAPIWAALWIVMSLAILLFVLRPERASRRSAVAIR